MNHWTTLVAWLALIAGGTYVWASHDEQKFHFEHPESNCRESSAVVYAGQNDHTFSITDNAECGTGARVQEHFLRFDAPYYIFAIECVCQKTTP